MKHVYLVIIAFTIALAACPAADLYEGLDSSDAATFVETCAAPPPKKGSGLFAMDSKLFWNNGQTLKVQFLDGTPANAAFVLNVASEWSKYANISFVHVEAGGDIRVTFHQRGFSSRIGTTARGVAENEPTMILGFPSGFESLKRKGVVLHEFGHVLGFSHEHQSPSAHVNWNEKAVIAFFSAPPNSWTEDVIRRNILTPVLAETARRGIWTEFDPHSIMAYPYSKHLTTDGTSVGINTDLSPTDQKKAAEIYKRP